MRTGRLLGLLGGLLGATGIWLAGSPILALAGATVLITVAIAAEWWERRRNKPREEES